MFICYVQYTPSHHYSVKIPNAITVSEVSRAGAVAAVMSVYQVVKLRAA